MSDDTARRIEEALADEVDRLAIERLACGVYQVTGRVRANTETHLAALEFLEDLAAEVAGAPVFVDGPVLDRDLQNQVLVPILKAVDRPEDVLLVRQPFPRTLEILVRRQDKNLSEKGNRLPKLKRRLSDWDIEVRGLGGDVDALTLRTQPDVIAFLEPFLREDDIDPASVHAYKVDTRVGHLEVLLDAEQVPPLELLRLGRHVRDRTGIETVLTHRVAGHRARDLVYAALGEVEGLVGHKVQWDDKLEGVRCTVDAPRSVQPTLEELASRLSRRLDVPVEVEIDQAGEVMVDRLADAFPPDAILTGLNHAEEKLYFAAAMWPMHDHDDLLAWSDRMEKTWGVQVVFEDPQLRAPDLRYRDRFGSDAQTIALRYNRPVAFPAEVTAQAEALVAAFDLESEVASGRRRDLRETVVLSIDPVRTKDLDDALSIEEIEPGLYRIGVHIADVAAFVPQGTPLDEEALRRSFTLYLHEGEIPVLPPVLSDQVCSLHGGEDSPALSLFVDLSEALEVHEVEIVRTAMHNHARLSYGQAQAVLDGRDDEHAWRLRTLDRLAQALRARRKGEGSLDLNLEPDPHKRSHQLIEEFMLLANECVARFLGEHHPEGLCLYRVHPWVGGSSFAALQQVAQYLRLDTTITDQDSMQAALCEAADLARQPDGSLGPAYQVMRHHVGRVLEKATYHFEQLGHGALAKTHYAHFTSPIRRYPDLIVHRLIEDALYAAERGGTSSYTTAQLLPIQEHVNAMEIRVDAGSFESHRLADLQGFDRDTRVEEGTLVGLMRGWASIRLDRTDLSVGVRYRDDKTLGVEMPVRVNDQNSGMALALGNRVTVRTHGVDWERASIRAEIIGLGGDW